MLIEEKNLRRRNIRSLYNRIFGPKRKAKKRGPLTNEHKRKLSEFYANLSEEKKEERRTISRLAHLGKKFTQRHKRRIAEGLRGHEVSIATRKKIADSRRGKSLATEIKKKIGDSNRGKKRSAKFCEDASNRVKGKKHHFYGKHLSAKHKQKISLTTKGRKRKPFSRLWKKRIGVARKGMHPSVVTRKKIGDAQRGERSHLWKGGITPLAMSIRKCLEYAIWRFDVFTRDNFTCVFCRKKGVYLHADHYPRKFSIILRGYKIKTMEQALCCAKLWDINNGRTLCKKCHNKYHRNS